jgi:hypothetical protein
MRHDTAMLRHRNEFLCYKWDNGRGIYVINEAVSLFCISAWTSQNICTDVHERQLYSEFKKLIKKIKIIKLLPQHLLLYAHIRRDSNVSSTYYGFKDCISLFQWDANLHAFVWELRNDYLEVLSAILLKEPCESNVKFSIRLVKKMCHVGTMPTQRCASKEQQAYIYIGYIYTCTYTYTCILYIAAECIVDL